MTCRRVLVVCVICFVLIAPVVRADVRTEERSKMEFAGLLGGLVKTFGGKSAREGVINKVALKGDRKMTVTDETAQLVDLAEEKVYQIDLKKKTYRVMTFEQMRRQMQEAQAKAAQSAQDQKPREEQAEDAQQPEMTIDFKIEETGQTKNINGYDTREIVTTITVHEKDKSADEGALLLVSSMWLAPRISELKELEDFDRKFAEKLYLPMAQDMAAQMAPAMGMYPGLKEALGKLEAERVNMDGTAVLTTLRAEVKGDPKQNQQATAEQSQPAIPRSLGGLLGGLGRRAAPKPEEQKSATFMTTNHELLKVSTAVADTDVAIPAGFKEQK